MEGSAQRLYKGKKIAVVIPAYNEQDFIQSVLSGIPHFVDAIVVVDDASHDETAKRVRETADVRVRLLANATNAGVGAATVRGYREALELQSDVLVKVDGDGQMPLEYLGALLDPVVGGGYDYAKGNRFSDRAALRAMPKRRLAGNIALTFLSKLASGYWHIVDPQNGFTAVSADALRTLDLNRLHPRYFFEDDMLIQLNARHARVKDVPMPAVYGVEESHLRISFVMITFPWLFLGRFVRRIYEKHFLRAASLALFSWCLG